MEAKLTNTKWTAIGKCSADTALREINALLARGVLRRLEGGGRSTGYLLVEEGSSPRRMCASSYQYRSKDLFEPLSSALRFFGFANLRQGRERLLHEGDKSERTASGRKGRTPHCLTQITLSFHSALQTLATEQYGCRQAMQRNPPQAPPP